MSLRVGTNTASIAAQHNLRKASEASTHAMRALSSGERIVNAGDDAAGFAISEMLRGQAESLKQARGNADSAKGLIQVAEGGLNEQNNILIRLRELAVQSASDTVGQDEREFINTEYTQLTLELDRISKTTTYGRKPLLQGTNEEFQFQLGAGDSESDVIRYTLDADTTASSLGLEGLEISDQSSARSNIRYLDEAMSKVAKARAGFGAIQSRLEIAGSNLDRQRLDVIEARSRIADADYGEEVSKMVQSQILQDFSIAVLAQANQDSARALNLL